MSINGYFRVKIDTENEIVIERSRFIAYSKKCETESEARTFLDEIRKKHPFATHNCYAYITDRGEISRFSDDGEPQGTAGQPILEVIKSKNLKDTMVVVTRYFGGVKLGAGGLVRAYSQSARDVLDKSGAEENVRSERWQVDMSYDIYQSFFKFSAKRKMKTLSSDFGESVKLEIAVPVDDSEFENQFIDFTSGKATAKLIGEEFTVYSL